MNFLTNILIKWYVNTTKTKAMNGGKLNLNQLKTNQIDLVANRFSFDKPLDLCGVSNINDVLHINVNSYTNNINLDNFTGKLHITTPLNGILKKHKTLQDGSYIHLTITGERNDRDLYIKTLFDFQKTILISSGNTVFDIKMKNQMTFYGTYAILEPLDRNNPEYLKLKQQHMENTIRLI